MDLLEGGLRQRQIEVVGGGGESKDPKSGLILVPFLLLIFRVALSKLSSTVKTYR